MSAIPAAATRPANAAELYTTLPIPAQSKYIRLLTVYPNPTPDNLDAPIHCDLSLVDLTKRPEYTALSYTWGKGARTTTVPKTIGCNGCPVPVTNNCYDALIHLRKTLPSSFAIWIDRVCINQADLDEKAVQIPLMGDIYQGAGSVYVWLGTGTPATDRAMKYLESTGFQAYYFKQDNAGGNVIQRPHVWKAFFAAATARWRLRIPPFLAIRNRKFLLRSVLSFTSTCSYYSQKERAGHGDPYYRSPSGALSPRTRILRSFYLEIGSLAFGRTRKSYSLPSQLLCAETITFPGQHLPQASSSSTTPG
jgi:hypothetical protein